jgi:hypothetical protein
VSAEDRLADYLECMECLVPIMTELNKLDMDTIEIGAHQLNIAGVQFGVEALKELKANVAWFISFYKEKIEGLREYVRGVRAKEQEAQEREHRANQ